MTVYETDVPGVGKKYELERRGGERLVVLVHHDGKRELFRRPDDDSDSEKLLDVDGPNARKLGSILEGAYFQPVEADSPGVPLGESIIDWTTVEEDSPVVGHTLRDVDLEERTGGTLVALQRGTHTMGNPDSDTRLEAGDVLVVVGSRNSQEAVADLVRP